MNRSRIGLFMSIMTLSFVVGSYQACSQKMFTGDASHPAQKTLGEAVDNVPSDQPTEDNIKDEVGAPNIVDCKVPMPAGVAKVSLRTLQSYIASKSMVGIACTDEEKKEVEEHLDNKLGDCEDSASHDDSSSDDNSSDESSHDSVASSSLSLLGSQSAYAAEPGSENMADKCVKVCDRKSSDHSSDDSSSDDDDESSDDQSHDE